MTPESAENGLLSVLCGMMLSPVFSYYPTADADSTHRLFGQVETWKNRQVTIRNLSETRFETPAATIEKLAFAILQT